MMAMAAPGPVLFAGEETLGLVLALDHGVQDVAGRRVADQRELGVVRAGVLEKYAVDAFGRTRPAGVRGKRPVADARTFGGHGAPRRKRAQPGKALADGQRSEHDGHRPTAMMAAVTMWER